MNEKLHRFLQDPRLSPAAWEALRGESDSLRLVSAVLATYNRCPYDPVASDAHRNPLRWCLDTLIASKACPLREIVVVNDGSTDYTADLLNSYDGKGIPLRVVTLSQRRGSGLARNLGIQHATSDLCLICDDDVLPAPFALAAGTRLFSSILATDPRAALLQFPVYLRSPYPAGSVPRKRIGRCVPTLGIQSSYFNRFPREYLFSPSWTEEGLLAPLRIANHSGVFIARRPALLDVGGFRRMPWPNACYEELDLSLRLTDADYTLWFSPDPRLHFCHLLYGGVTNVLRESPEPRRYGSYELSTLIRESNRPLRTTGNRVSPEEWFESKILSRFVVFGTRSRRGAWISAFRAFADFVLFNRREFSRTIGGRISSRRARARIWATALRRGITYLRHAQTTKETERCPFPMLFKESVPSPNERKQPHGWSDSKMPTRFSSSTEKRRQKRISGR